MVVTRSHCEVMVAKWDVICCRRYACRRCPEVILASYVWKVSVGHAPTANNTFQNHSQRYTNLEQLEAS